MGVGATCGTAVAAAGTGVFATGGGAGLDLPPDESSSSPLILMGSLDIGPSTMSPERAVVTGWTGFLDERFVPITTGSGVTVGGTGVAVGGTGVAVGGIDVAVGDTCLV